jgi:hypothetical protein
MLAEPIGHLLEPEPHVLEADLLRNRKHWHGREQPVRRTQEPRQHGAVAHASIENVQRRWRRPNVLELLGRAPGDRRFLVARVDERQVLLAIVVEPERRGRGRRVGCRRAARTGGGALVRDIHAESPRVRVSER